ncbi:MAG: STAS domain-containing protein [Leptospiraceae bacterium]|nr:STAS domain-containing protein [Leptospiraceae bacterium]MCP5510427.1 STAS domain-containing protein [Leptospiraceae bacterium]
MTPEVSILQLKDIIIVPIQIELHDEAAKKLQGDVLKKLETSGAKGLIVDISAVFIVDSFLGRLLADTARMASVMGAIVVLTGLRKDVALTLIQLGLNFKSLKTALNLDEAMEFIENEKVKRSRMRSPKIGK